MIDSKRNYLWALKNTGCSKRFSIWLITSSSSLWWKGRLTVLHLWVDQQASSTPAHRPKHWLLVCETGRICCTKIHLILPSSPVSSHTRWFFPPGSSGEPNRRREDVCERGSSSVCLWVCTHVSEVEEGRFSQIVFQFLHHPFPLPLSFFFNSPPPLPFLQSLAFLARQLSSIHLPPTFPPPSLSVWSKCCLTAVQRACAASGVCERLLMAGDLTNGGKRAAVMGPFHGLQS